MKIEKIARKIGKELARQEMEKQALTMQDIRESTRGATANVSDALKKILAGAQTHIADPAKAFGRSAGQFAQSHPQGITGTLGGLAGAGAGYALSPEDASASEKALYALGGAGAGAGAGAALPTGYSALVNHLLKRQGQAAIASGLAAPEGLAHLSGSRFPG